MKQISFILLTIFLVACGNKVTQSPVELIAHAGGDVGVQYSNSREALEKSIADGFRYIEFDLLYTADSILVAAHDWEQFNKFTGFEHKGDTAPTFADFSSRRINGKYTPLSAADINTIFEKDTTIYLVTDKISSPVLLAKNFPRLKERMVVEAFSYNDYEALRREGYHRVLYSCMATDLTASIVKHMLLHTLFSGPKIEWITMYVSALDNTAFRLVDALVNFNIALFTINNYSEIPRDKFSDINKVKMIYTDNLKP